MYNRFTYLKYTFKNTLLNNKGLNMKKIIAVVLISTALAGCASGPDRGHYYKDENGQTQYEPSAEAKNADNLETVGWVAGLGAAIAALTLGIVAVTK